MSPSVRRFAPCVLSAILVVAGAVAPGLMAQQAPLELHRLDGPIEMDGVPDEPAWAAIPALPLTLYAPTFGGVPTQRSEIRVAYDDEHFYAAGWFYDEDPAAIRINSLYRDRWNGDDAFAIYIDAFNDDRNAKWFGTTAAGMRFDQLVSDDGATLNGSWDAFWTSRSTVTEDGWFVEVRIPFSTLGFQPDADGSVVMGLTVTRLVSRLGERVTFPAIDPADEFRKPSVARDVVLRDVRSRRPLYVTPYALAGVDRAVVPGGTAFEARSGRAREVGLDVRYPLSGTLTLDLTINTDFAQVEADDQQVNLDRFPLFYPERRRFFQEGSGIFDWATGGDGRLFHSRRIGLAPDFTPVPVLAGARLVGRVGEWDVGLLEMQTAEMGPYPSENFGVVRLRRGVLNPGSTVGFMATSYLGGERHAFSAGADGLLRIGTDQYVGLKVASIGEVGAPDATLADRSVADLSWERRTGRGLQFNARLTRAGAEFRPELGFTARTDFTRAALAGNWFFFTDGHPVLRRVYPGAVAFSTWRNDTGVLESGTYAFWVQWDTKAGGMGWLEPKWFHEDVAAPFSIGGTATVPAGVYDFADFQVFLRQSAGTRLRTLLDARAGTYFDGTRVQAIVGPTWNLSRHLEVGGEYQVSLLRFDARDEAADIHVARLRVGTALNAALSGNALVQFNSTTDRLDFNVRLRYAFAEGTDLWLVYNEGLDTERGSDFTGVESPLSRFRALILKYSHTFGL